MSKRPIDAALQAYNLRDLQTFRNIIIDLDSNELNLDQALRYIWFRTMSTEIPLIKVCPECEESMTLYTVNNTPCTQVNKKYRSQWFCTTCGHSIFNLKPPFKILHEHRAEAYNDLKIHRRYQKEMLEWEIDQYLRWPLEGTCPECNKTMMLHKINTPVGKANVHGYQSVWYCDFCGYEKYSTHTVKEEATRLRRI